MISTFICLVLIVITFSFSWWVSKQYMINEIKELQAKYDATLLNTIKAYESFLTTIRDNLGMIKYEEIIFSFFRHRLFFLFCL
jgi:hypothetical protein